MIAIIRMPCLMEDEGRFFLEAVFNNEEEALSWLEENAYGYFHLSNFTYVTTEGSSVAHKYKDKFPVDMSSPFSVSRKELEDQYIKPKRFDDSIREIESKLLLQYDSKYHVLIKDSLIFCFDRLLPKIPEFDVEDFIAELIKRAP